MRRVASLRCLLHQQSASSSRASFLVSRGLHSAPAPNRTALLRGPDGASLPPSRCRALTLSAPPQRLKASVFNLVAHIEDMAGITAVREAQEAAVAAEREFVRVQDLRRDAQGDIRSVQQRLKEIHVELDRTARGEDRYLKLLTEEHAILKDERARAEALKELELRERSAFNELSARLRESHEKERERAERTKYWSIIGTVVGALLGILGSAISHRMRMASFRELVESQTEPGRVSVVLGELEAHVKAQQEAIRLFIADLRGMSAKETPIHPLESPAPKPTLSEVDEAAILAAIRDSRGAMAGEMAEVRRLLASELGYAARADGSIVYVGPELRHLLDETERNLEWKMKIAALVNVVCLYAALCITLPIIAGWLGGAGN